MKPILLAAALLGMFDSLGLWHPARAEDGWLSTWFKDRSPQAEFARQGGLTLKLHIETGDAVKAHVELLRRDAHRTLSDAKIAHAITGRDGGFDIVLANAADTPRALQVLANLDTWAKPGSPSTGKIAFDLTGEGANAYITALETRDIEVIGKRISEITKAPPWIEIDGSSVTLHVPGVKDVEKVQGVLSRTGRLEFRLVDMSQSPEEAENGAPPLQSELLPSSRDEQKYLVMRQVLLSGDDIEDAAPSFDSITQEPVVTFRFTDKGRLAFAKATTENVNHAFAIVLDGRVLTAPIIREPITGGSGQISGGFTAAQAQDTAALLRSGALPAPIAIISQSYVPPIP